MSRLTSLRHLGASLLAAALLVVAAAPPAAAQTTTGTIRGYVHDSSGAPFGGAMVEAKNVGTSALRTTTSNPDGSYVLAGLVPAVYDLTVRHIGSAPSTRRVVVQIGSTTLADVIPTAQAVEVAGVNVLAAAPTFDLKTSEVATNISTQQMQQLPTQSRNFLDFAQLAPGVQVTEDVITVGNRVTSRNVSAGGGSPNQTNVFIDGASLKNDLTGGGIAGQDASRGNPFPQNAIQEYRVITQNFKAEYQQAGTAIINATTKSGTNEWHGTAQFQYSDKGFFALDSFQIALKNQNPATFAKPDFSRSLPSVSIGGPLMRDKLFFF
ncbi:MAG TPA: carboxypeptidase regulatory-like domain-containing protein, partial [Gemmatimonadales bacterium]|nr:carboxypeptidase regulatory-like domain-containing protein [Gemmatimonadales bacterium]